MLANSKTRRVLSAPTSSNAGSGNGSPDPRLRGAACTGERAAGSTRSCARRSHCCSATGRTGGDLIRHLGGAASRYSSRRGGQCRFEPRGPGSDGRRPAHRSDSRPSPWHQRTGFFRRHRCFRCCHGCRSWWRRHRDRGSHRSPAAFLAPRQCEGGRHLKAGNDRAPGLPSACARRARADGHRSTRAPQTATAGAGQPHDVTGWPNRPPP